MNSVSILILKLVINDDGCKFNSVVLIKKDCVVKSSHINFSVESE